MNEIALIFPGQGSQVLDMGKDFCENFRESLRVFQEASDVIHLDLRKLCFGNSMTDLTLTPNLQPALFVAEAAMLAALRAHTDLKPIVTAGHSLGEYTALHAAGSISIADGARITRARGTAMQEAVPAGVGTMAAILGMDVAAVEAVCAKARTTLGKGEVVEPANFNAPGQVVIAGTIAGVAKVAELLKDDAQFKGGKSIPLKVSAPFHCSLMAPAQKAMAPLLVELKFLAPSCQIIPNVTANAINAPHSFGGLLTDQITRPVRWEQSMKQLRNLGVKQVYEIGPGKVLTGLHRRIDGEMPVTSISTVQQMTEAFK